MRHERPDLCTRLVYVCVCFSVCLCEEALLCLTDLFCLRFYEFCALFFWLFALTRLFLTMSFVEVT
jgi:hypothetical protein